MNSDFSLAEGGAKVNSEVLLAEGASGLPNAGGTDAEGGPPARKLDFSGVEGADEVNPRASPTV